MNDVRAPAGFFGTVGNLLVEMEPGRGHLHFGIGLFTCGVPAKRVQALQEGLTQMAERALAGPD